MTVTFFAADRQFLREKLRAIEAACASFDKKAAALTREA